MRGEGDTIEKMYMGYFIKEVLFEPRMAEVMAQAMWIEKEEVDARALRLYQRL